MKHCYRRRATRHERCFVPHDSGAMADRVTVLPSMIRATTADPQHPRTDARSRDSDASKLTLISALRKSWTQFAGPELPSEWLVT